MANEKRLIDANVVLAKQFTSGLSDASGNYYGYADIIFADDISNSPTVDAEELVHGRWVTGIVHYVCSVCGNGHLGMPQTKYCPDCGAKMDGDGNG